MAMSDHYRCTINEAERTILELGARMRQRMEELHKINVEVNNGCSGFILHAQVTDELEIIKARCYELMEKKRRDMASLQNMIDNIKVHPMPAEIIVRDLESIAM